MIQILFKVNHMSFFMKKTIKPIHIDLIIYLSINTFLQLNHSYTQMKDSFLGQFKQENYVIKKEYINSKVENVRLYHTKFTPHHPTRTIAIVHGFGEHSSRFYEIAHFFANNSFEVLLIDLTGFGYSGGPRGCATMEILQNDVISLLTHANPELPLFMYAHSMGGLITIKLILERPEISISGCVITSPFLSIPKEKRNNPLKIFIVKLVGDQLEDLIINSMVNPTALTKKNNYLHTIFQDRLMIPFLSVKMAKSLLVSVEWVQKKASQFSLPIIIFHGKKDSVVQYQGSRSFVYDNMKPLKVLHLFENGYHQLQHDVQKDELLERALKFIESIPEARIKKAGNIIYSRLQIPFHKKSNQLKRTINILVILGILVAIFKVIKKLKTGK